MTEEHPYAGTPISARHAAAISAMIDDVAATAAEGADGRPTRTGQRKQRSMGSACRYEEVCRLGEGEFSVVAKARHHATGQHVVHLTREACFMAACRGEPSHVGLHGIARAPGTGDYSLVMDFVGPTTLLDVIGRRPRQDGPFPEADVHRVMRQLLAGAEAMHRRGIVHRDIKPENTLVGDGGALKICDFGAAKYVGEQDPPYLVIGTMTYMALEALLENPDHDTLVDSWSLGCVMADLLADDKLFLEVGEDMDMTGQLYQIFDVLGVPGKRAWQSLKPSPELADKVQQWRARQRRVGHRNRLRDLFPEEVLSKDGFEVLRGLLTCDPKKRLTAAAALRCRWFTDNVDDGPLIIPGAAPGVWKAGTAMATTVWSQVVACVGRALGLLRPKALLNLTM
ncbi:hypothetical protein PVAP13_3KG406400 [Panicum virgatum]|uniref:[RNA-polymerase]-subunit kinase n=1 Tax=Panicum virgatum TaxID=38727 RepID=A0A8T0V202_PANVG|nr:hypothetical protein PVAP13_3KG406400 [Panicum virgatum]